MRRIDRLAEILAPYAACEEGSAEPATQTKGRSDLAWIAWALAPYAAGGDEEVPARPRRAITPMRVCRVRPRRSGRERVARRDLSA